MILERSVCTWSRNSFTLYLVLELISMSLNPSISKLKIFGLLYRTRKKNTGCSLKTVSFPRILESLPPLPRQHSAAIGCMKNYQPIGVTVHSYCVESFVGSYKDVGEGEVAVNSELKKFLNTMYLHSTCKNHLLDVYVKWNKASHLIHIKH